MTDGCRLDTIILLTRDMPALARWYEDALDLPPFETFGDDHMSTTLPCGRTFGFDRSDDPPAPGPLSLWFEVPGPQGLQGLEDRIERLRAAGVRVRMEPNRKPWGDILAAVEDPDGNVVGLFRRPPGD